MQSKQDIDIKEYPNQLFFRTELLNWYNSSHRPLPWKGKKNPYLVWLSEIILQQTRVEQGMPYYHRFVERFPDIKDLADAQEDEVMKLWEGLGYYSRARNLHATAKYIAYELGGRFPETYSGILNLKGVGPYTAAAISSFAFDLPHAVVDGNVFRVLSRFFGIDVPIDTSKGKKLFSALAQELLDKNEPARYNQAIMDFGATHCTPKNPKCNTCLLKANCQAFLSNQIGHFPKKSKKISRKTRYFHYLIFNYGEEIWIRKRTDRDIWKNLYEFPMLEGDGSIQPVTQLLESSEWKTLLLGSEYSIERVSKPYQHLLTHQKIIAIFIEIQLKKELVSDSSEIKKIERKNLSKFAFPKLIDCYLMDKSLYLNL